MNLCHSTGVVPRGDKKRILVETEADRETVLNAFKQVAGVNVPIKLVMDKSGYLRSRAIKTKKAA